MKARWRHDATRGLGRVPRFLTLSVCVVRGRRSRNLTVPDDYWGGADRDQPFAVFRRQSIGPRLFLDAIAHDLEISPSFYDGHQVQRIIEGAVESDLSGRSQVL